MSTESQSYRPLVVAGVLLVLIVILWVARGILIPIAVGILLTFILTPPVNWLQTRGLRRFHAVLIVVSLVVVLLGGLASGLALQMRQLADDLPTHKEQFTIKIRDIFGGGPGIFTRLSKMIDDLNAELKKTDGESHKVTAMPVYIVEQRPPGVGLVAILIGPLSGTLGALGLTAGLTIAMLVRREDLRNRLFLLLGEGQLTTTTRALDDATRRISGYLLTHACMNAGFGLCFGVGLAIIGVPYSLVWGVMAGLLRFAPYIGTWLAAIFPFIVSLSMEGWGHALVVVLLAIGLGVLCNNVLEPRLVSRSTGVTPIALVVSMAFWTWLWGPIGLILSTPMAVCLSVLGRHVPSLRFLDIILGAAAPLGIEIKFYQRLLARDEIEAGDLLQSQLKELPAEVVFDQMVGPALARARADHERSSLLPAELTALVKSVRDLLDSEMGEISEAMSADVVLLACPVHDDLDRLTLEMLARIVLPGRVRIEIVNQDATASEVLAQVTRANPALVCLVSVPPAGGARARYLCKRLRAAQPNLPLLVTLFGTADPDGNTTLREQMLSCGASQVTSGFAQAREQLVPRLQVAAHLEPVQEASA